MKTAIKLVLIDLLIAQIIAPILIMIPCTIYLFVTTGNLDKVTLTQMIMIPAQLAGQIMMGIYLWKAGYISKKNAAPTGLENVERLFHDIGNPIQQAH